MHRETRKITHDCRAALRYAVAVGALMPLFACARNESAGQSDSAAAATASAHMASGDVALPMDSAAAALGTEVRFLNAVPSLPSLILVKGDGSPEIHTEAGTVTPYRPFVGDALQLALVREHELAQATPNDSIAAPNDRARMGKRVPALDTLAVRREMIPANGRYTVIAMPSDDGEGVTIRLVADSVLPDTSVAQVRLIHAAPLAGEFDLLLVGTNSAVFQGVAFANATSFQRLAPSASQQLALRQESRPLHPTTVPSLRRLDAGKAYTIVITGRRDAWDAVVIRDDVSAALATRAGATVSATPATTSGFTGSR